MVCTWLTDNEFELYSTCDDIDVNEVLQQIREINPVWFVDKRTHIVKRFLRKPISQDRFTLYQVFEYPKGNSSKPEVRIQMSANTKANLLNFLYGLNVGYHFNKTI